MKLAFVPYIKNTPLKYFFYIILIILACERPLLDHRSFPVSRHHLYIVGFIHKHLNK